MIHPHTLRLHLPVSRFRESSLKQSALGRAPVFLLGIRGLLPCLGVFMKEYQLEVKQIADYSRCGAAVLCSGTVYRSHCGESARIPCGTRLFMLRLQQNAQAASGGHNAFTDQAQTWGGAVLGPPLHLSVPAEAGQCGRNHCAAAAAYAARQLPNLLSAPEGCCPYIEYPPLGLFDP